MYDMQFQFLKLKLEIHKRPAQSVKLKAENSDEAVTEGAETEHCLVEKENKNGLARRSGRNIPTTPSQILGEKYSNRKRALHFKNLHPVHRRDQTIFDKGKCHPGSSH